MVSMNIKSISIIYMLLIVILTKVSSMSSEKFDFVRIFQQNDDVADVSMNAVKTDFKTVYYAPVRDAVNVSTKDPILKGVNVTLCTHLIFIPCTVDKNNNMVTNTPAQAAFYQLTIPAMKRQNPNLVVMISNALGHSQMSPVMGSLQNTTSFVNSAVLFLRKYGFDGLDLDWEFPSIAQYYNYSRVLTELRKAFEEEATQSKKPRLLLTTAVLTGEITAPRIYNFTAMKMALDFVNMMGYDLNTYSGYDGSNNGIFTSLNSPMPALTSAANYWASKIGRDKVVVGIPFYSHAYKLLIPKLHGLGVPVDGRGECENQGIICACNAFNNKNATVVMDGINKAPYCYYGNQWITFENMESIYYKTKWILDNGFTGLMVWTMQSDDYNGMCYGIKNPLMKTVINTIKSHDSTST